MIIIYISKKSINQYYYHCEIVIYLFSLLPGNINIFIVSYNKFGIFYYH